MKGRRRKEKKPLKKKDIIKVKIPESCYKCIWGTKSTVAKIKCTKKDAVVIKEDEGWMCCSYTDKNVERK